MENAPGQESRIKGSLRLIPMLWGTRRTWNFLRRIDGPKILLWRVLGRRRLKTEECKEEVMTAQRCPDLPSRTAKDWFTVGLQPSEPSGLGSVVLGSHQSIIFYGKGICNLAISSSAGPSQGYHVQISWLGFLISIRCTSQPKALQEHSCFCFFPSFLTGITCLPTLTPNSWAPESQQLLSVDPGRKLHDRPKNMYIGFLKAVRSGLSLLGKMSGWLDLGVRAQCSTLSLRAPLFVWTYFLNNYIENLWNFTAGLHWHQGKAKDRLPSTRSLTSIEIAWQNYRLSRGPLTGESVQYLFITLATYHPRHS